MWEIIQGWATQHADKYLYVPIPPEQTDTSPDNPTAPAVPYGSYVRLWLCEMCLKHSRHWFHDCYPAVHASVQVRFGDRDDVTFSHLARVSQEYLSRGVHINYPLTELLPYNGGVVEVEAALLALHGTDMLETPIKILQDFSNLVTVPLGQVLTLAETVGGAIRELVGATDGRVHLGFHQAFASAGGGGQNMLMPGYIAVILATRDDLARERLSVQGDRLHYQRKAGGLPALLRGFDYMLLRIETRHERDNWHLETIETPLNKAIEAMLRGDVEQADAYRKVTLATVFQSPDLAIYDRRRVAEAIKKELSHIEAAAQNTTTTAMLGSTPAPAPAAPRTLTSIMAAHAMPTEQAATLGEVSFHEVMCDTAPHMLTL